MSTNSILTYILADIAVVLIFCALLGKAVRRVGQPVVVGQILTGLLLGELPRAASRGFDKWLFPAPVIPYLTVLSQVAVVVFVFAVGYEIDFRRVRGLTKAVPAVAAAALAVPLALGAGVGLVLGGHSALGGRHASGTGFVLFMGVTLAITALPVLAAIVRERGSPEPPQAWSRPPPRGSWMWRRG